MASQTNQSRQSQEEDKVWHWRMKSHEEDTSSPMAGCARPDLPSSHDGSAADGTSYEGAHGARSCAQARTQRREKIHQQQHKSCRSSSTHVVRAAASTAGPGDTHGKSSSQRTKCRSRMMLTAARELMTQKGESWFLKLKKTSKIKIWLNLFSVFLFWRFILLDR